jgi:hypothetical protein
MIKVTLEIDNNTAHSCSPLKYLEKFILLDAKQTTNQDAYAQYVTPYAKILVTEIEQI